MNSVPAWYQAVADDSLEQGDFFGDCQIVVPRMEPMATDEPLMRAELQFYDVVVLSQSCDLVQNKLNHVLVSRVHSVAALPELAGQSPLAGKALAKLAEQVRRGNQPPLHMLARCDIAGLDRKIMLVDFREVFSVPMNYLRHRAREQTPRLRLNSPYREHLSQAFARYFMRVGLPSDIPPFK